MKREVDLLAAAAKLTRDRQEQSSCNTVSLCSYMYLINAFRRTNFFQDHLKQK